MEDRNTLYIKKGDDSPVNTFTEWGIVCVNVPFKAGGKVKALATRDWHDEDGDDTFIPSSVKFEAYDADFELAYKGKELASNPFDLSLALTNIESFKHWLTGNDARAGTGAELKIYSPFSAIARQGCYLLEISDEVPHVQTLDEAGSLYHENVVTFRVRIRVTDPVTDCRREFLD